VDTRSRVEATGLARSLGARNGTLGRKGRRRQSTLFIPWRRGEDGVEGGVLSALPHNGREEGGSIRRPRSRRGGHRRHVNDPETAGVAAHVGAGESKERGD
jgi:hypothetical protein